MLSEITSDVSPEEVLARYIFSRDCFSPANDRVKYSAFLPAPDLKTSVFRVSGLTPDEIWHIGDSKVAPMREKPLLARADISAKVVLSNGLDIEPDNDPRRHANIYKWPSEKSEQKLIAIELANKADLHTK